MTSPPLLSTRILKKEKPDVLTDKARETATRHAQILEHRKEIERTIFDSLETLSLFPSTRGDQYSADRPAAQDITEFKQHIRLFQPSDYDDLIEERNANNLCGYALCPNNRRKFAGTGQWQLINKGRKNFDIARKADVEKWCSQSCARKALYIKVQLNESAAWERAGLPSISIELFEESEPTSSQPVRDSEEMIHPTQASHTSSEISKPDLETLEHNRRTHTASNELADERNEVVESNRYQRMDLTIRPKEIVNTPKPPLMDCSPDAIEGHLPKKQ